MLEKYAYFITPRQVEQALLKCNFDMLDQIFGEGQLEQEDTVNVSVTDQLKVNFSKWKQNMRELFEIGKMSDDPALCTLFVNQELP